MTPASTETIRTNVFGIGVGANLFLTPKFDLEILLRGAFPNYGEHNQRVASEDQLGNEIEALDTLKNEVRGFEGLGDVRANFNLTDEIQLRAGAGISLQKATWFETKTEGVVNVEAENAASEVTFSSIVGISKEFDNDFKCAFEGVAELFRLRTPAIKFVEDEGVTSVVTSDSLYAVNTSQFILSAEKGFGQTKLFDNHYFRIAFSLGVVGLKYETDDTIEDSLSIWGDPIIEGADAGLDLGFGFDRGKFGFDMYVSNLDFDFSDKNAGIWGFMPVAGATLTVNFAKPSSTLRSKKARSVAEPAPVVETAEILSFHTVDAE